MSQRTIQRTRAERGFSLIELLTVIAILTLVMGVVFKQIVTVQQRYRGEEAKLDIAQESREFLDQIVRDLHQVGYPTARMYSVGAGGAALASPPVNDTRVAAGLVRFAYNDLQFEGDVDGDGVVDVVRYTLSAPGGTCPCTIQRSQVAKLAGAPMSQTPSYSTELQNVINSGGSYTITGTGPGGASNNTLYGGLASQYIFLAFNANGDAVLPTDIGTNPNLIGSIRSIQITVNVLAKQSASDLQTGRRSAISLTATAQVSNH